jgi:hypothetical protein
MKKVSLNDNKHLFQMLGAVDGDDGYVLPFDIAQILLKLPKKPVTSKDEINVGQNIAFLETTTEIEGDTIQFVLENNNLFLLERAHEIGGLVAFTYLIPLAEITAEYFTQIDATVDLSPLKARIQQRRVQYTQIIAQHERLARSAAARARKTLATDPIPAYDKTLKSAKRFARLGKPDFNASQLELLAAIIDKKNLQHPASEIVKRWKDKCHKKTAAAITAETATLQTPTQLHQPKMADGKPSKTDKGKKIDFHSLVTAMTGNAKPKAPKPRIKPSDKATEILNSETEIEAEFSPEVPYVEIPETMDQLTPEETKLQQLVSQLLSNKTNEKPTKLSSQAVTKGKRQVRQSQHALDPLNHGHEQ